MVSLFLVLEIWEEFMAFVAASCIFDSQEKIVRLDAEALHILHAFGLVLFRNLG
jgi:hypothetical protein